MKPTQLISGTFVDQAAAIYLGLGFIPDFFKLRNLSDTEDPTLEWNINMRTILPLEGYAHTGDDDADMDIAPLAYGAGVTIYRGGTAITSSSTPSTSTYLARIDNPDKRDAGTGDDIDTWTLDTSGDRTGHWNDVCNTTYVGVGSRICVDGKWATVTELTGNGEADDEVTLSEALKSGNINMLTNIYDWVTQASGTLTKAGVIISDTTYLLGGTTNMLMFEAGTYR